MNLARAIKTVLWSFIGLGGPQRSGSTDKLNPLVVILVAFVLVLLFLGTLALVARRVAG